MDDQYKSILEELAKRKMEQPQTPIQVAEGREPASISTLPVSGSETKMIQDLNILDKIKMKAKGLDPWNPNDVQKYRDSGTEVQMADGGIVPRKTVELDNPQFIPSSEDENVRYTLKSQPQGEPIDYNALNNALKKTQESSNQAPVLTEQDLKPESLTAIDNNETPEIPKEPENYQERMGSQKKVEDIVSQLQEIPDENFEERVKKFNEIQKQELTPLEKQKLHQWADQDWQRMQQVWAEQEKMNKKE